MQQQYHEYNVIVRTLAQGTFPLVVHIIIGNILMNVSAGWFRVHPGQVINTNHAMMSTM